MTDADRLDGPVMTGGCSLQRPPVSASHRLRIIGRTFLVVTALLSSPLMAAGWDSGPWDGAAFDASTGASAGLLATVAKLTAESLVYNRDWKGYANIVPNAAGPNSASLGLAAVTGSARSCSIDIGSVTIGGGGTQNIATNVTVQGDVINICN